MTTRRRYVGGGQQYTINGLTEAAERAEQAALDSRALAMMLRYVRDRLACDGCDPVVEIPVSRDGKLLAGSAYATHELDCSMM